MFKIRFMTYTEAKTWHIQFTQLTGKVLVDWSMDYLTNKTPALVATFYLSLED